ncbi:MAG: hypothetical protein IT442_14260 [Phycisphaeraceae bacterium]|nr:hypothetical protein [Phycisphaeraceae bacterium]
MLHSPRLTRLLAAASLGLIVTAIASAWFMTAGRAWALAAGGDLRQAQQFEHRIRELRQRPQRVASQELLEPELAKKIESAATAANLPTSAFDRIEPQSPQRVGNTPYLELTTRLSLRQVALPSLLGFLYNVSTDEVNLSVKEIRLSAPRGAAESAGEAWNAEVALAYWIYAPANTNNRSTPSTP